MQRVTPALKLLILLINLVFSLAFTSSAQAAQNFKGKIKVVNGTYLLVTKNQVAYSLEFTSSISEQQIKRLNNGDFASVTANISSISSSLLYVTSVDYVGLKDILGTWRSNENMCYEFSTFTRLYVYSPNWEDDCVRSQETDDLGKYNYFINPDVNAWNMLLSSSNNEFFGNLTLTSDSEIELELFDARTDANLGTVVLRR